VFAVRYIAAVTWTVEHDGLTSQVSAGALTGRQVGDCDDPTSAIAGVSDGQQELAATGSSLTTVKWALLLVLAGATLSLTGRRLGPRRPRT
jgi:hypothetical protein